LGEQACWQQVGIFRLEAKRDLEKAERRLSGFSPTIHVVHLVGNFILNVVPAPS
jgi:hypothetical protein